MIPNEHVPDSPCNPWLPIYYFTILRTRHSEKGVYKNRAKSQQIHTLVAGDIFEPHIATTCDTLAYTSFSAHNHLPRGDGSPPRHPYSASHRSHSSSTNKVSSATMNKAINYRNEIQARVWHLIKKRWRPGQGRYRWQVGDGWSSCEHTSLLVSWSTQCFRNSNVTSTRSINTFCRARVTLTEEKC